MPHPPSRNDRLAKYRSKRSPHSTPEPFGESQVERPGVFVVQKHAARHLHFDFRLEVDGVLKSWVLPKGPSLDSTEKRFAIATEDHPVEYADFEGLIPEGNYGAGAMIVWDHGLAVPHIVHREGLEDGKLLFELRGFKLRGLFTLVKTKKPKEWLLIKKPDAYARETPTDELGEESVFSGLTLDELKNGHHRAEDLGRRLIELEAPRQRVDPALAKVMLCESRPEPFSHKGWAYEIKYDGYRLVAAKSPSAEGEGRHRRRDRRRARLFFRSGLEATVTFPDLARAISSLPFDSLVLDGEVVVLDEEGRPSFSLLQQRGKLTRPHDVERAAMMLPAVYFAFDLLGFEDYDLRPLPYSERKALLRKILPKAGPLRFVEPIPERGEEFYTGVRQLGLEGMVAKRTDASYQGRRSPDWVKVRADHVDDFVVVGFQRPEGSRTGFRSLHLAILDGATMTYAGKVGSGFSQAELLGIRDQLEPLVREEPACSTPPKGPRDVWVEPQLVAEVRFTEYAPSGHLRHPSFLHLREDKRPEDCVRRREAPLQEDLAPTSQEAAPRPEVPFTNLDKVFWPEEGYTKGDLVDYYRGISPWLLPYLRDRPVVMDRYPDGIHGKNFFQKNAPDFAPEWMRTETIWSEETGGETLYFVCDHVEPLLYLVNLGTIPLHIRSSRLGSLQTPDWCVLDLDAKEATFEQVVQVAQAIHELCEDLQLPAFAKTSGATGMHVLVPLGGQATHEQGRMLSELLARVVVSRLPEVASVARMTAKRQGQVYVDFLQNGYGQLLVAPFSARPRPGGPVSMPLAWNEVQPGLDPRDFTLRNAVERLESMGDPLASVFDGGLDLPSVLTRLASRMASGS